MDVMFSSTFLTPRDDDEIRSQMPHHNFSAGPSSTLGLSHPQPPKKRRNKTQDLEDVDVIALSPTLLMSKNRFICEVCNKGFPREQNLQFHIREHDLPWNLKAKGPKQVKRKVYVCPEASCPHNDPSRALGDLTGLKKHYLRKHSEKKYECDKCTKKYAILADCKAHSKICGTREYTCDCGTIFSRRDHFVSHQTTCDVRNNLTISSGTTLPLEFSYIATPYRHQPLASPQPLFVQPQLQYHIEENEVPFGFLYPNQSSSSFGHDQLQTIPNHGPYGLDQLRFDSNENDAASSSYASFVNFDCFLDNGTNYTSEVDNHQQYSNYGFVEDPFNLVSSGNFTSEEISPLYNTLPQAINQTPSTSQMSAPALLQDATNQNVNNFGSYVDNGTGYLHDIVNRVASSSSSIISSTYNENFEDMNRDDQYFSERFHKSLAAVGGEGTWFDSLKPDAGPKIDFLGNVGMGEQILNTKVGDLSMSPLDLQAGNIGTSLLGQHLKGNYISEEIQSFRCTSLQAIQNPSTSQMSAPALLQTASQFGSTSFTSPGTNNQQLFFDIYQPFDNNACNIGAIGDNGTSYLQDIVNPVAGGSSSSIMLPNAGPTVDVLGSVGMAEQTVNTNFRDLCMSLSDLQAGNIVTSSLGQHFGDPDFDDHQLTGNYEEIPSFYSTSLQAIQNPSTAQMSAPALLQNATQFGSISSTSPGATNPNNQNANNFGSFGDNGTGCLQEIVNPVASSSYTSIFGCTYNETFEDKNSDAQYFHERFHENLAAVGGEDTWFGSLKADIGPSRDLLGIAEQRVNTYVGDLAMKSLDLQAGNIGTSTPGQHFGDI